MKQRRNVESVKNFILLVFILQNCGAARGHEPRRAGLARHKLAATTQRSTASGFNFVKFYETLLAHLFETHPLATPLPQSSHVVGRGVPELKSQLLWDHESPPQSHPKPKPKPTVASVKRLVIVTTPRPFSIPEQLSSDKTQLEHAFEKTTVRPFSVTAQLYQDAVTAATASVHQQANGNETFDIWQQLSVDKAQYLQRFHKTTVRPFSVPTQLMHDTPQHDTHKNETFNILEQLSLDQVQHVEEFDKTTVKPFNILHQLKQGDRGQLPTTVVKVAEHKAVQNGKKVPAASGRKKSNQRRRKRVRRRRKRIRRRRKRTRKRRRRQRKRRRKKRKKKRNKKKLKKDKGGKRKKKNKYTHPTSPVGQPVQVLFTNPTKKPYYHDYHEHEHGQTDLQPIVNSKPPLTTAASKPMVTLPMAHTPFKKIKYLLRHNSIFKKKKKEYLSHLGHVIYPFVKFIAFFTVLNPFTLGVFLFTLVSPVVFGFIGFVALSVLVKPALHLIFGVKRNVDLVNRRRQREQKRRERLRLGLRPITIHKHYYHQKPIGPPPAPIHLGPQHWHTNHRRQHNPALQRQPPKRHLPNGNYSAEQQAFDRDYIDFPFV